MENKTPLHKHKYMELTNKGNLPQIIVDLVSLDLYDAGSSDISVTSLIDAPQIRYLKKTNKVQYDASDFLWTTLGSAIHGALEYAEYSQYEVKVLKQAQDIFERHKQQKVADWVEKFVNKTFSEHLDFNVVQEKRLFVEVDDWTISGKPDRIELDTKTLIDFKMTSAWVFDKPDQHDKYRKQLSIYRYMLHKEGIEIDTAKIIFIFRDWSKMAMFRSKTYPRRRVEELEIDLMSLEETEAYIKKRIFLHKQAELGNAPLCTEEEMWARDGSFKCYKKKGKVLSKKAMPKGTFKTFDEALAFKGAMKEKLMPTEDIEIKYIEPVRARCAEYCPVAKFCGQYQDFLNNMNKEK